MSRSRNRLTAIILAGTLGGCGAPADRSEQKAADFPETPLPALPVAEPPLDRKGLLFAISESASAQAAGRSDHDAQGALGGKRFEVRLRFGCPGDETPSRTWMLDEVQQALRFRIDPDITLDTPIVERRDVAGAEFVQGFSIERPWLLDAGCPISQAPGQGDAADRSPAALTGQPAAAPLFAIAQFFSENDPRTHLGSNRPLSATTRLAEGEAPSPSGYDLVLSGRLEQLADRRVIFCGSERKDTPPSCIVSARFDRISLQTPDGNEIAHWSAS